MKKILAFVFWGIALILLFIMLGYYIPKNKPKEEVKTYKYAVVYYPDKKTSIEGYVEKLNYSPSGNMAYITIDGETYCTGINNCLIIQKKDLNVVKEDQNESK